jgi:hypothetical protein
MSVPVRPYFKFSEVVERKQIPTMRKINRPGANPTTSDFTTTYNASVEEG